MPDSDQLASQSHLELEKRIREHAHRLWLARTGGNGSGGGELEDWLQAEREVLGDDPRSSAQNRGTTVGDAHAPDPNRMEQLGEA